MFNPSMSKTTVALPSPAPGTRHHLAVYRYGDPDARPKAYLQAALHADEWPGLLVLHHLRRLLERAAALGRILGQVLIVPVANPIGLDQHINGRLPGRFDFGGSGNFNRNFPDLEQMIPQPVADRLSRHLADPVALIRRSLQQAVAALPRTNEVAALKAALLEASIDADMVLDLHCDGEALLHIYASRHQRDDAVELGRQLGAAAVLLEEDPGGTPFDEANAGPWWKLRERLHREIPLACFATTVELRGRADVDDSLAAADALNLYAFLRRRGIIGGDSNPLPPAQCEATPLEGVDLLKAPATGIIAYRKMLGDRVRTGETVAELVDLTADDAQAARTPLKSGVDGVFFARMAEKLVRPGQTVCKIAGRLALPHRQSGKLLED
jgi:predicted deacylase